MRIEKLVMASAATLMLSAAVAKVIGLKTNRPGLQGAAPYLLVAGFCVLLIPLAAALVYIAYRKVSPNKNKDRTRRRS